MVAARNCRKRLEECLPKESCTPEGIPLGNWSLSKAQSDVTIIYEDIEGGAVGYLGHWPILVQKSSLFEAEYKKHVEVFPYPKSRLSAEIMCG